MIETAQQNGSFTKKFAWVRGQIWICNGLLLVVAFCLGWRMHTNTRVQAESAGSVFFQLSGLDEGDALTLYYPDQKALYVYQGILTGNAYLGCTYRFQLGKPGEPITRHICPITVMH